MFIRMDKPQQVPGNLKKKKVQLGRKDLLYERQEASKLEQDHYAD